MDFSWSPDQQEFHDRVRSFAEQRLNDTIGERDGDHRFGIEEWRLCGEFGLLALPVPTAYGGMGLDALTTVYVLEAFGRGCKDGGLLFSASAHQFACLMPIVDHGSDSIRNEVLPSLCSGEWIGANAITEPGAGSDVFAMDTRASLVDGHYVINGQKSFVTNGPIADVFMVYASTNPKHGHMGISAFVIRKDTPGLTIGKPFTKLGLTTSPICSIYFDDCRVPAEYLVGPEGRGANVFKSSMNWERACLFGIWLGTMGRQLDEVIKYAKERKQFGKPIGKYQAVAHRIADMRLRLDASRLLLYRACWCKDQGQNATMEIAMAKLAVSEAAIQASLDSIQIHGAAGYVVETGIERALRDTVAGTIYSGTSEIQRQLVAQHLGL